MKTVKTLLITQKIYFSAQVEVTEEEVRKIENGEYSGINYNYVDKHANLITEVDFASESKPDPKIKCINLDNLIELDI